MTFAFHWLERRKRRPCCGAKEPGIAQRVRPPTTHILKLPIGPNPQGIDLSTSVENEWLCAQLVAGFGVPVAQCRIEKFGDQPALVVERFDRRLAADGKWFMRLPQEDFCQATATAPALKYESEGGPGIGKIDEVPHEGSD